MDVVYIYSHTKSDELAYSIKSLKNLDHREIYIIGDDPQIKNTVYVPCIPTTWQRYSKYHNQIAKLLTATKIKGLSEDFICMNDDFFIMKQWHPINYNRGLLQNHILNRQKKDMYQRSLGHTLAYLNLHKLPTLDYELHVPFIYNKSKLRNLIENMQFNAGVVPQIRSIYGNTYSIDSLSMLDVKNPFNYKDHTLLSTSNASFRSHIGNFIKQNV